jgi:hypothetical protein
MISNLPIISGEKIKLVFLGGGFDLNDATGGFCYANGMMSPRFLPIEGEYNDYGSIEEIVEDWNYHLITKLLREAFAKIEVEEEEKTEFNLEDIIEGVERGSLKVMRRKGIMNAAETELTKSKLSFAMIRLDVWDAICNDFVGEFWNDNEEETAKGEYYISAKTYCQRKADKMVAHMAKLKEIRATGSEMDAMRYSMLEMRDANIFKEDRILRGSQHDYGNLFESEGADFQGMLKAWTEMTIIHSFLEGTRKSWMVQQGKGSQSSEWELYKMLNKIVDKICDENMSEDDE